MIRSAALACLLALCWMPSTSTAQLDGTVSFTVVHKAKTFSANPRRDFEGCEKSLTRTEVFDFLPDGTFTNGARQGTYEQVDKKGRKFELRFDPVALRIYMETISSTLCAVINGGDDYTDVLESLGARITLKLKNGVAALKYKGRGDLEWRRDNFIIGDHRVARTMMKHKVKGSGLFEPAP